MYHLLVANEERGFDLFEEMFHGARQLYQLSTCDLLLDLAEEQETDLSPDNQLWLRLYKGRVACTSTLWDEALETWEALEREDLPEDLEGWLVNDLGFLYQAKGEWDQAIEYLQRSLAILEKVGDEHGMSTAFNNLGGVYQAKGEWDQAIEYYQRSLAIKEKMGDEHGMSTIFNNLGLVCKDKGEWDKAIEYYQRSLAIKEKMGDEHGMSTIFNNLGLVYKDKGEWDKVFEYLQRSLKIVEKLDDVVRQVTVLSNLLNVTIMRFKFRKALEYEERLSAASRKLGIAIGKGYSIEHLWVYIFNRRYLKAARCLAVLEWRWFAVLAKKWVSKLKTLFALRT
jgi:tetratricopeptide (TPR) repeat protein